MAAAASQSRPWTTNANFAHSDRERWICVYPAYINSRKTIAEGRRIPKEKAVDNPTYSEMRDVCSHAGMTIGVENKVYPREVETRDVKYRGRIRIQLRQDDNSPMLEQFPNRKSVLLYLCEKIPQMKTRTTGGQGTAPSAGSQSSQAASTGGKKKKGKKK